MRDKTQVLSTACYTLSGSHPVWTLQTLERHLEKGREMRWLLLKDRDLNALVLPHLHHKLSEDRKSLTFLLAFAKVPSNSEHVITPAFP